MGARLRRPEDGDVDPPQAVDQLQSAVAIHNILEREGVAYLADEVGTGKTYVALGAIALFRHFNPSFRVAVIAPRENIQAKWIKEWFNFATYIARIPDLRVKALHGGPARPLVKCDSLQQFIRETTVDPDRDFFLRLTSFSLGAGDEEDDLRQLRRKFERELPWVADSIASLKSKREFKDSVGKALCCALPTFDLLVIDEGHNLKHGFAERIAARNRVLAFTFGRPSDDVDVTQFRNYGPRAKKVLFLSATPIEDDYRQLWNQLDVFGKGGPYQCLRDDAASEEQKRTDTKRFLVRRVTTLEVDGQRLTKNLYRREWREGGLASHDDPIRIDDVRQRLVVALVQKKVAELLNTPKFNASFQMGMLASFESFLETVKLKKSDEDAGNFDDSEQTDDEFEREGIDVKSVNELAADYRRRFNGAELPHPKMDALVAHLCDSWTRGRKALVFLRRVASVWEVKERLDRAYNEWLIGRLRQDFEGAGQIRAELDALYAKYTDIRAKNRSARLAARMGAGSNGAESEQDRGGDDTFFAWFFRGEGPEGGWLSGAKYSQRFAEAGYELSTFFEDNYAADLLGVSPGDVLAALATAIGQAPDAAESLLAERAAWYLTRAKRPVRRDLFEAAQGGALDLLKERAEDLDLRTRAATMWQIRFEVRKQPKPAVNTSGLLPALEFDTLFSALRAPEWAALREALWPTPKSADFAASFSERELRRELFATMARLGHPIIDVYAEAMRRRGSLKTGTAEESERDSAVKPKEEPDVPFHQAVLAMLERQRIAASGTHDWSGFDELSEAARNFHLILDVNEPSVRTKPLVEAGRVFGALLRQQQPVGGMTGQVNKTLVRQFRMPGYPFVLLSTDLLQEGEDLHTFCSDVYHYGLAWTPSAVEQRIGRVDRVRSKTERTASTIVGPLPDEKRLQVFYPHLEDTVERLQVRRVLRRMHEFLRLMHEGLGGAPQEASRLNVTREIVGLSDLPEPIKTALTTAFPVESKDLEGQRRTLAVTPELSQEFADRLSRLRTVGALAGNEVIWDQQVERHCSSGLLKLDSARSQHFLLHLQSFDEHLVMRCVSHVGRIDEPELLEKVKQLSRRTVEQLGLIEEADDRGVTLTVEEEVLLGGPSTDEARVGWLVTRVAAAADRLEQELWDGRDTPANDLDPELALEGRVVMHVDRAQ